MQRIVLLSVCVCVALVLTAGAVYELLRESIPAIRALTALPEGNLGRPEGRSPATPFRLRGRLLGVSARPGTQELLTPQGRASPLWIASLICSDTLGDGGDQIRWLSAYSRSLRLRHGTADVPIKLFEGRKLRLCQDKWFGTLGRDEVAVCLSEGVESSRAPEQLLARHPCADRYVEYFVPATAEIEALGCLQEGEMTACGDGLAALTVQGTRPLVQLLAQSALTPLRIYSVLDAVLILMLAYSILGLRLHSAGAQQRTDKPQ